jgi:large subunit ribosomal protein L30e
MSVEKLQKALKEKELNLGESKTLKNLKLGKVKVVFLASNCKPGVRETIKEYNKHSSFEVFELEINAAEVGTICKKQFPISILSY